MASTAETTAASTRVFTTYELLEDILLHLPLRQLLLSQNINKACFDVVQRSRSIRQALFLSPGAPVVEIARPIDWGSMLSKWRDTASKGRRYPIFNPFCIVRALSGNDHYPLNHSEQTEVLGNDSVVFLKAISRSQKCSGFICKRTDSDQAMWNQSRNDMLLTQPPVGELEVEVTGFGFTRIGAPTGATHGDLMRFGILMRDRDGYRMLQQRIGIEVTRELEPTVCWLQDTEHWVELTDSVDEVTGYAMLELIRLAADGEKVVEDRAELIDDMF